MASDSSIRDLIRHRWSELSLLLDEALELDPAERDAWMAARCPDAELRVALGHLLADSERETVIDRGSEPFARVLLTDETAARAGNWIGRRLGVYRLARLIGEGGMSSVFLAERDDGGFDQQVAVKVLRHGMLDPYEQQRFLRERQILARLEHPNIARLIDGGLTSEGVPWFAMEYVPGTSITSHCDSHRLDIEARLALFLQVCDAVSYAHRALVVHRDLKPSNILVSDAGALKLLDFGIARLSDDSGSMHADATVTSADRRRLTPAYAAPEQWRGEMVTTSADVYALGVLLHELLTGLRPSRRDDDTLRLPSAQFATADSRETLASSRDCTTPQLRHRLTGDLDMILRAALHPEPARRYASVAAFAEDIRRHLEQRPVKARPDSIGYRLGRYVRRHRVGVIAMVLVLSSIAAGVVATLRQAERARAAAVQAQIEAGRASAVKNFLVGLFSGAAPNQTQGRSVTARELLDRGARGLDDEMVPAPALRAELQLTLAGIYRELGQYDQAEALLSRIDSARLPDPSDHRIESGRLAFAQGRYEQAETELNAALADRPATVGERNDARRAETLVLLAEVLAARDRKDEAEKRVREAIALDEASGHPDTLALARDQAVLAQIAFGRGDLPEAERAMRDALRLRTDRLGETHTVVATTQHDLAVILLQRGDVDEAERWFDQALATRQQLLGPRHAEIASTRLNLGALKRRQGDRASAQDHYRQAATMLQELFPEGHPELAVAYNSLALIAQENGDLPAAIEHLDQAIALSKTLLGDQHPNIGIMLGNRASMLRLKGDYAAAEIAQRESLTLLERAVGKEHHLYAVALNGLAFIELEQGATGQARDHFLEAAAVIEGALGEEHPDYAAVLTGLSEAELKRGDRESARTHAQRAMTIVGKALPEGHPRQRRTQLALAEALAAMDQCADARETVAGLSAATAASEARRLEDVRKACP